MSQWRLILSESFSIWAAFDLSYTTKFTYFQ